MRYKKLLKTFLFFLLLQVSICAEAQTDDVLSDSVITSDDSQVEDDIAPDTSLQFVLRRSTDSIDAFKQSPEFSYIQNLDSLLKASSKIKLDTIYTGSSGQTKQDKTNDGETDIKSNKPSILALPAVKVFLWILAGVFILFILYKLFFSQGIFRKEKKIKQPSAAEEEQPTELSDFEKNIQQALKSGNYRLAVRYLYLQTLHRLSETGQIHYSVDKTNYQYVREVYNKPYRNDFAALTLNYEYIWYGNFEVDHDQCMRLQTEFNQFNQKI